MLRCANTDLPVWKLNKMCHRGRHSVRCCSYCTKNDLPLNIHGANMVMFADDINILITDSDVCAFQTEIDRIEPCPVGPAQKLFVCGSLTIWTLNLVVPILGLSSGDWLPWASERARGGYAEEMIGAT